MALIVVALDSPTQKILNSFYMISSERYDRANYLIISILLEMCPGNGQMSRESVACF